tara:strand:+ start:482 stop:886 length:405 start_codon:yes stop_codon:yes gene_type:complete
MIKDTRHEHSFSYSQEDVVHFANVSGDKNPIHLNEEYAKTTPFKRKIMHGMLSASIFSKVLGTDFPGPGTIYLAQSLKFLKPMYVDTQYTCVLEVKSYREDKGIVVLETSVLNSDDNTATIVGEATVKIPVGVG